MQTRDEKLEVAAGEYAQAIRGRFPEQMYITLVDAYIAGAKWMETEHYYYGNADLCQVLRDCIRELQTMNHTTAVNTELVEKIKNCIKSQSDGNTSGRVTQSELQLHYDMLYLENKALKDQLYGNTRTE